LIEEKPTFMSFAHHGTKPQRICCGIRLPSCEQPSASDQSGTRSTTPECSARVGRIELHPDLGFRIVG
jgi:hypothetical protein